MQMASSISCHHHVAYSPGDFAACISPPFRPSPPSPVLHQAIGSTPSCFLCYDHDSAPAGDVFPYVETISSTLNAGAAGGTAVPIPESGRTGSFGQNKITSPSSSSVQPSQTAGLTSKTRHPTQKRKHRVPTPVCGGSANSKDDDGESRKPKRRGGAPREAEERKPSSESPVAGYVHLRARRGEATDSHSLAERVRREKIREKMRALQDLVPGCDKVVGKALLLEEIINYVQSLQNQVQFLSVTLASLDPMFNDAEGLGFLDYLILQAELDQNISLGVGACSRSNSRSN